MNEAAQASAGKSILTTPAEREIRVERVFNAPRDRVWRAYTEPELVAQWWGRGNELVIERLELERGGRWRFVEHVDGKPFGFEGTFREVTPQDRLVYTFGWDGMPGHPAVETAEFEELDGQRTRVVAIASFVTGQERDAMLGYGMEQGLNQSYAALDALLARLD
jgi:uncharacterized protein YndB with AHSA1/START domain